MTWKKKEKILEILCNNYINMVDINRKTYERNGTETIADNDRILWLNKKLIEEGVDHKNTQEITMSFR